MRGKNLGQFLKAIDLLGKAEGVTTDELAEELKVDKRSVYRLIQFMEELNFPITDDDKDHFEKKKRWKLEETFLKKLPNIKLPNISLTLLEIIALSFLKGEGRLYKGTDIEKNINSAFAKIDMFTPPGFSDKLDKVKTLFIPVSKFAKNYSGKEKIIEAITDAVFQKKTCLIEYHSFGEDTVKQFRVDPLHFFENNGGLYIFARITRFGDIRTLAVERILSLESTDDDFKYPKDFNPTHMLDSAFDIVYDDPVHAKIWFSSEQARYIKERQWAKEQKIKEQKDGSIILEIKTSGWWDIKKWVLSFGAEARVLKPEKLRKAVIEEIKAGLARYS